MCVCVHVNLPELTCLLLLPGAAPRHPMAACLPASLTGCLPARLSDRLACCCCLLLPPGIQRLLDNGVQNGLWTEAFANAQYVRRAIAWGPWCVWRV